MHSLLSYCTGFGLATGAGGRACLAVFALGSFHYTPYFELAPRFAWVASPPVLTVLAVIGALEILADAHPEIGELAEMASYLPKVIAGLIAFAAATGDVDSNILQLGASGIMGAFTAGATQFLRHTVRDAVRDFGESTHSSLDKFYSYGETGAFGILAGTSFLLPILVPLVVVVLGVVGFIAYRKLKGRKVECLFGDCEGQLPAGALVCTSCQRAQNEAEAAAHNVSTGSHGTSGGSTEP